jgi:hypothetical protein
VRDEDGPQGARFYGFVPIANTNYVLFEGTGNSQQASVSFSRGGRPLERVSFGSTTVDQPAAIHVVGPRYRARSYQSKNPPIIERTKRPY